MGLRSDSRREFGRGGRSAAGPGVGIQEKTALQGPDQESWPLNRVSVSQ